MGFKCFRLSVNWSRIYPTGMEEEPNEKGLAFYHNVFAECRKYNIEPLVTISHYELPWAFRSNTTAGQAVKSSVTSCAMRKHCSMNTGMK